MRGENSDRSRSAFPLSTTLAVLGALPLEHLLLRILVEVGAHRGRDVEDDRNRCQENARAPSSRPATSIPARITTPKGAVRALRIKCAVVLGRRVYGRGGRGPGATSRSSPPGWRCPTTASLQALRTSPADWKRSSGRFCIARAMTRSKAGGQSRRHRAGRRGAAPTRVPRASPHCLRAGKGHDR